MDALFIVFVQFFQYCLIMYWIIIKRDHVYLMFVIHFTNRTRKLLLL